VRRTITTMRCSMPPPAGVVCCGPKTGLSAVRRYHGDGTSGTHTPLRLALPWRGEGSGLAGGVQRYTTRGMPLAAVRQLHLTYVTTGGGGVQAGGEAVATPLVTPNPNTVPYPQAHRTRQPGHLAAAATSRDGASEWGSVAAAGGIPKARSVLLSFTTHESSTNESGLQEGDTTPLN
jgi:hypothetical protein